MKELINTLSDKAATQILATIAKHHPQGEPAESLDLAELTQTLPDIFDAHPVEAAVTDGEMARTALLILAQDAELAGVIKVLAEAAQGEGATPDEYRAFAVDPLTAAGLTAAIIFVLKTSGKIERDKNGKLKWHVAWKPLDKDLLKEFVDKLLTWIPSGPFA